MARIEKKTMMMSPMTPFRPTQEAPTEVAPAGDPQRPSG